MTLKPELNGYVSAWQNEHAHNNALHAILGSLVDQDPLLKEHRDFVENPGPGQDRFGFGDRPFHYVWKMLVEQMPESFLFLEVGVYKAQVLSLVELLAKREGKSATIHGVTTLDDSGDRRCKYPKGDYAKFIETIFEQFKLSRDKLTLHIGRSSETKIRERVAAAQPFNIVYIDGCHDYEEVVDDVRVYAPMTAIGGFLVMDDASIGRWNMGSCWSGLEEVGQAVKDTLDTDPRFKFLLAVGHLNVFQRIGE